EIRRFEEGIADLYHRGEVPSSAHLYIGQEAVAVGVCSNLRREDYILTTHRGHAHNIAKGVSMRRLAAEILGKATGLCKGKGGSMRASSFSDGVVYACPIVGANIPIAAGVGLSIKLRGTDQVVACFFGEGASNIGDFHEGINLAALWRLPVVYVCENNLYALSISQSRSTLLEDVASRASAYGIPGVIVDGNDVLAVYEAAEKAVENARRGEGPTLIECKTYRWLGHHAGDPGQAYRSKEEVERWREHCPIKRFRGVLLSRGAAEEVSAVEAEVKEAVKDAMDFALESPYPDREELLRDIF
ncbi:MAG: thiamine pyrophosphate-dependent dehydrogenase E1 component subunit alpha, partial [Candidatus Bathyarchaeia archaeon]